MRMSPTIMALIFFVVLDSAALYVAYIKHRNALMPVSLSAPAPDFEWKGFDGSRHTLKELSGHVVVLHFWAAWCPPCRDELPKMVKEAATDKDIIYLAVSSDDNREKPMNFIKMASALSGVARPPDNVIYAWDPTRTLTYDQFFTASYPETIIIDPGQRMRRKFPGEINWDGTEIRSYLKELKEHK